MVYLHFFLDNEEEIRNIIKGFDKQELNKQISELNGQIYGHQLRVENLKKEVSRLETKLKFL